MGFSRGGGFTLIEIVLALGIVTFALVGILGLFPLALETAQDSKNETRIAMLAQSIMSDIKVTQSANTPAGGTPALFNARIFNGTTSSSSNYNTLQVGSGGNSSTTWIAYTLNTRQELMPKGNSLSATDYANGVTGATFIASISITYDSTDYPGIAKIVISIESPGSAPSTTRKQYLFTSFLRPE